MVPVIDHRNNFDLLRLLLASAVFLYHIAVLSRHPDLGVLKDIFRVEPVLDAFFIISGFLVFMSFENSRTMFVYFEKRLRRIYPAYLAIVLLCAGLGYFLSSYPATEYYFSNKFLKYLFANTLFLNFIEPGLPGIFAANPLTAVNGSLWTIRNEVMCYLLVPLVAYLIKRFNRLAVFISIEHAAYRVNALLLRNGAAVTDSLLAKLYYVPWHFLCFMSGAILYYYFDIFKSKYFMLLMPALVIYIGGSFLNITILNPLSLATIVVSAASFLPYIGNFARFGDLSYGIYIIHFPIVQTLIAWHAFDHSPAFGLLTAVFIVFLLAFFSWHMLEKPFLKRSSHYLLASAKK